MNIFAFDAAPDESAQWLDDIRQNKMILETAQLLSTAIHQLTDKVPTGIYRPTHKHHPCTVWVTKSRGNFKWTVDYLRALGQIRNPNHKSLSLLSFFETFTDSGDFPLEDQTPFANCARNKDQGLDFTTVSDTHEAYRLYISERWKRDTIKLSWHFGQQPKWRT